MIQLPDYVPALARDFTIHVTPHHVETADGEFVRRYLGTTPVAADGTFKVYGDPGPFDWVVYGKRLSVNVEPDKGSVHVNGQGPYRWIE